MKIFDALTHTLTHTRMHLHTHTHVRWSKSVLLIRLSHQFAVGRTITRPP